MGVVCVISNIKIKSHIRNYNEKSISRTIPVPKGGKSNRGLKRRKEKTTKGKTVLWL